MIESDPMQKVMGGLSLFVVGAVLLIMYGPHVAAVAQDTPVDATREAPTAKLLPVADANVWPVVEVGTNFEADGPATSSTSEMNPDFGELRFRSSYANSVLSPSGYPYIVVRQDWPACESPFVAKEARDAWQARDQKWMASLSRCYVLRSGLRIEWKSYRDPYDFDEAVVRVRLADGSRPTLYLPWMPMDGNFALPFDTIPK